MRFDDSLKTVLAADISTAFGAQSAFRQIVDLMGRGRIAADDDTLARLRHLRAQVPAAVRVASARALALATPDARLVAFFAEDEPDIAAPVLRSATLDDAAWSGLLPRLGPAGRSVLRGRTDLAAPVRRALASFGSTDFSLGHAPPVAPPVAPDVAPRPPEAVVQPTAPPRGTGPFVALGTIARELPIVAEALRQAAPAPAAISEPRFEISELVERIAAFQRDRDAPRAAAIDTGPIDQGFRFETDAEGIIRRVEGIARNAVIGVSLAHRADDTVPRVDGVAAGAFRQRTAFVDARLDIAGASDSSGAWRISGTPVFDESSGRFAGFRGVARRPRADETAAPARPSQAASESLRRLVHELRTPTNAIAGFAELIDSEMLGPVPPTYRDRAATIRAHIADLVLAIDDLDMAARIEGDALELRQGLVPIAPMLTRIRHDLAPLARLRDCAIDLAVPGEGLAILGDDRAVERLIARLMAALVSASAAGERIAVRVIAEADRAVAIAFDRPASLAIVPDDVLLSIDAESEAALPGAPLLGMGFALRLARNLAAELGGGLTIDSDRLTLRLPAGLKQGVGQASNS